MSEGVRKTEPYEIRMVYNISGKIFDMIQYCKCDLSRAMWMDVERGST